MNKTAATPRPWHFYHNDRGTMFIVRSQHTYVADCHQGRPPRWASEDIAQANAELIVRCVNSHDQLVAALEQAVGMLDSCGFESPEDDPELVASWEASKAKINAALAAAKEKTC